MAETCKTCKYAEKGTGSMIWCNKKEVYVPAEGKCEFYEAA